MRTARYLFASMFVVFAGCSSGGGGGGGSGSGSGDQSSGSGGSASGTASKWLATAEVTGDTCGERISAVRQVFQVSRTNDQVTVDTGIVTLTAPVVSNGFTLEFQETNGNCQRTYTAVFSDMTDTTANVKFSAKPVCNGTPCESTWTGSATTIQ